MRHRGKAIAVGLFAASTAQAQVLNFEGINAVYPSDNFASINGFYNGGTSSQGRSGVNLGIQFSTNALAICLNTVGNRCSNTSRGGVGNAASRLGGLFFLDGAQTFMNRAAGFTTGFSFFYTAPGNSGSFTVWSGLERSERHWHQPGQSRARHHAEHLRWAVWCQVLPVRGGRARVRRHGVVSNVRWSREPDRV